MISDPIKNLNIQESVSSDTLLTCVRAQTLTPLLTKFYQN